MRARFDAQVLQQVLHVGRCRLAPAGVALWSLEKRLGPLGNDEARGQALEQKPGDLRLARATSCLESQFLNSAPVGFQGPGMRTVAAPRSCQGEGSTFLVATAAVGPVFTRCGASTFAIVEHGSSAVAFWAKIGFVPVSEAAGTSVSSARSRRRALLLRVKLRWPQGRQDANRGEKGGPW